MTGSIAVRIAKGLSRRVPDAVSHFADLIARDSDALAVLFYGSNLRTGSLDGVLDYYVLLPGPEENGVWPRVSYRETTYDGLELRAKIATLTLAKFAKAASGELLDTTIWARFVQPSALVWSNGEAAERAVSKALEAAARTAGRLAAVLGPSSGTEADFWTALFQATYKAEFRIETVSRAQSILELNREHFDGLLPLALKSAGIPFARKNGAIAPQIAPGERRAVKRWWARRRRMGKVLNLRRLLKAASTFDGAARYAAWKIERHSGVPVELTPWRERHPILAAPGVLISVWLERRKQR